MQQYFTSQPQFSVQPQTYPDQVISSSKVNQFQHNYSSQQYNNVVESQIDLGSYNHNNNVNDYQHNENQFNDFEEDQMTKNIRVQEERISKELQNKSEREYQLKASRIQDAKKTIREFQERKENQKEERKRENVRKEQELRDSYRRLNEEAGWRKVVSNINVKQGEHKGKKDVNRMREAILHKRQDDSRS